MGLNVKYHIVVYENDSIVKDYQIDIEIKITQVTLKKLQNLKMENMFGKKCHLRINLIQIIQKSQQIKQLRKFNNLQIKMDHILLFQMIVNLLQTK
ncbi:unnamed protein product [Paramecium pentaurelia]|uniref:Uncharacterized protein n=1 Tax=Paramecium pentaurelia TaxID=43138 RepID=A0A8S1TAG0_9CILI|nr:unnamed protein product [Paramecium pentaurelia]